MNQLTITDYNESTDEITVALRNENTTITVSGDKLYQLHEELFNGEKLGALDTALANLYRKHFDDSPHDLLNLSAEF